MDLSPNCARIREDDFYAVFRARTSPGFCALQGLFRWKLVTDFAVNSLLALGRIAKILFALLSKLPKPQGLNRFHRCRRVIRFLEPQKSQELLPRRQRVLARRTTLVGFFPFCLNVNLRLAGWRAYGFTSNAEFVAEPFHFSLPVLLAFVRLAARAIRSALRWTFVGCDSRVAGERPPFTQEALCVVHTNVASARCKLFSCFLSFQ